MARYNDSDPRLNADTFSQYGVLKYSIQELVNAGSDVVTSIQDVIGEKVSAAYTGFWQQHVQQTGQYISKEKFYADRDNLSRAATQPLDLSIERQQMVNGQAVGGMYPGLNRIHTVGAAQNFLHGTVINQMLASSDFARSGGQDGMSVFQSAFTGYLEKAPFYEPFSQDGDHRNYSPFASRQGFYGSSKWIDAEASSRKAGGGSLEAMTNDFGELNTGHGSAFMGSGFERPPAPMPWSWMQKQDRRNGFRAYDQGAELEHDPHRMHAPASAPGSLGARLNIPQGAQLMYINGVRVDQMTHQNASDLADYAEAGLNLNIVYSGPNGEELFASGSGNWYPQREISQPNEWIRDVASKMGSGEFVTGLYSKGGRSISPHGRNYRIEQMYTGTDVPRDTNGQIQPGYQRVRLGQEEVLRLNQMNSQMVRGTVQYGADTQSRFAYLEDEVRNIQGRVRSVGNLEPQITGPAFQLGPSRTIDEFNDVVTGQVRVVDERPASTQSLVRARQMAEQELLSQGITPTRELIGERASAIMYQMENVNSRTLFSPTDPRLNQYKEAPAVDNERDDTPFSGVGMIQDRVTHQRIRKNRSDWAFQKAAARGGYTINAQAHLSENGPLDPVIAARLTADSASPAGDENGAFDLGEDPSTLSMNALVSLQDQEYGAAWRAVDRNQLAARMAVAGARAGWPKGFKAGAVATDEENAASRAVRRRMTGQIKYQENGVWKERFDETSAQGQSNELNNILAEMDEADADAAARVRMVGDPGEFRSAVAQIADAYGVDISYVPGKEAEFEERYNQLRGQGGKAGMAADAIRGLFPEKADQLRKARAERDRLLARQPVAQSAGVFGVTFGNWLKNNPKGKPSEYFKMLAYQTNKGMSLSPEVRASVEEIAANNARNPQILSAAGAVLASGAGNSPTAENTAAPARAPETGHNIRGAQAWRSTRGGNPLNPYDEDVIPSDPTAMNTPTPARRADPVGGGFKAGDRVIVNGQEVTVRENYGGQLRVSGPDGDTWVDRRQARPVVSNAGNSMPSEPEMPNTILGPNGEEIPAAPGGGSGGSQPPSGNPPTTAAPDPGDGTPEPTRRQQAAARNVAEGNRIAQEHRTQSAQRNGSSRMFPGTARGEIGANVSNAFVRLEGVTHFQHPVYGTFERTTDQNGEVHYGMAGGLPGMRPLGDAEMREAERWAQDAMASSTRGPMPSDPGMAAGSMRQRQYQILKERGEKKVDELVAGGMAEPEAKVVAEALRAVSNKIIEGGQKIAERELELEAGERAPGRPTSGITGGTAKRNAINVSGPGVIELAARSPQVREQIEGMGLTPEKAAQLSREQAVEVYDDNGLYMLSGGQGGAGRNASGNRNLWNGAGKFGQLLYGAYLINREWKMLVGDQQAQANQYLRTQVGYAPMLSYGGGSLASTDAGAAMRQEIAQNYQGRIAQQMFGGFNDIGYGFAANGDDGAARLLTGAKVAGGLGMGSALSLSMLGQMGVGWAAGAATPVGLGIGLAALGAFGVMEGYNAIAKPAVPATPGNIVSGTTLNWRTRQAEQNYVSSHLKEYDANHRGTDQGGLDYTIARGKYEDQLRADANNVDFLYQKGYITKADYDQNQKWAGKVNPLEEMYTKLGDRLSADYGVEIGDVQKTLGIMMRAGGRAVRSGEADKLFENAGLMGIGAPDLANRAAQYASAYGIMGSQNYAAAFNRYTSAATSEQNVAGMDYVSAKINQLGSQLQAYMPATSEYADVGNSMVRQYNLTPGQTMGASSLLQAVQSTGGTVSTAQSYMIAGLAQSTNPTLLGKLSNLASDAGNYFGVDVAGLTEMLAKGGMNQDQANLALKIAGGDIKAMSWATYQNPDNATTGSALRTFDQSGNAIWETNGLQATQWASGQAANQLAAGINSPLLQRLAGASGPRGVLQAMGAKSERFMNAFLNGVNGVTGYRGVQLQMNQDQYDAQMASIGAAAAGVRLQQQFYWGSGSWDAPAEGSYWNLEDRMIGLKDTSARADMEDSRRRMEMSNRYSIAREDNQWARMQTSYNYNEWQSSFNYAQQLQQRTWTQQDWQYQDQTRALQFGWSMSDMDEQIRYSSGRQRRSLIRQRDRATISQNMEDMQIERGRDRQEETWKKEDERFTKQAEYQATLKRLDTESFELNRKQRQETYQMDRDQWSRKKKEYEEQKSIEDEMRKLQRKFQADQLALQLAQIGAQAEQAKRQKEVNDDIARTQESLGDLMGAFQNISNFVQSRDVLNALGYALSTANNAKYDNIMGFQAIFSKMNELDYMKLRMIRDIFSEMQ